MKRKHNFSLLDNPVTKKPKKSSSSNDEDEYGNEINYLLKSYTKKKSYNKGIKKSKYSSSSQEEEEEYDKNTLNNLKNKLDFTKRSLSKIMDIDDEMIVIDEIQNKKSIPRADGLVYNDPDFGKIYPERYGKDWIKQLTDARHILENDLNYKFLRLIAGKIETDVTNLISTEDLENVVKYNEQIFQTLKKERERVLVPSDKKQEQILILEKNLTDDRDHYKKFYDGVLRNQKLLEKGNLLIDSDKRKDIPLKLHDQGILYILNIEDEFLLFTDLLDIFFNETYPTNTDVNFREKIKRIQLKTKEMIKEIYNTNDDINKNPNSFGFKDDEDQFDFVYYSILLLFKYYLNCFLNQSPKNRILKRFKYLVYDEDYQLSSKVDEKFNKLKDGEKLDKKISELKSKYTFNNNDEFNSFQNLTKGAIKLIDLVNDDYDLPENIMGVNGENYKQIMKIDWELFYNNKLINLRNFFILFYPSNRDTKIYSNDYFDATHIQQFFNFILQISKEGCNNDKEQKLVSFILGKNSRSIITNNPKDFEEDYSTYLYENNTPIYKIMKRVHKEDQLNPNMIFISHCLYNFFMESPENITKFIIVYNSMLTTLKKNILHDMLHPFYMYYKMNNIEKLTVHIPFIIDNVLIKYMKKFYFITLNQYLFDIVKILYDQKIILFPREIQKQIEGIFIGTLQIQGEEESKYQEIKIDASFYNILNESINNTEIKIQDPGFQDFLNSFNEESIKNKQKIQNNLGKDQNIDYLLNLLKLPTESLNIKKTYKGYSSIINLHIYFNLYQEYLLKMSKKIKKTITSTEKSILQAKNILSRIASEKIDLSKIEESFRQTYQNPLQWIIEPFNSGVLIIKDFIIAAINDAFYRIKQNSYHLKDITLPVIILAQESGLTNHFAILVSYIVKEQRMNTPIQYYKVAEQKWNFMDVSNKIMSIIKDYRFVKSGNWDNNFLGYIYFKQNRYPIYTNNKNNNNKYNIAGF